MKFVAGLFIVVGRCPGGRRVCALHGWQDRGLGNSGFIDNDGNDSIAASCWHRHREALLRTPLLSFFWSWPGVFKANRKHRYGHPVLSKVSSAVRRAFGDEARWDSFAVMGESRVVVIQFLGSGASWQVRTTRAGSWHLRTRTRQMPCGSLMKLGIKVKSRPQHARIVSVAEPA